MGFHCLVSTHFLKEQYVYYANRRVLQIKFKIGMYLQGMRPNKVFLQNKVTYILNATLCSLYKFVRTVGVHRAPNSPAHTLQISGLVSHVKKELQFNLKCEIVNL